MIENRLGRSRPAAAPSSPLYPAVLIPITAEDVFRRRRRLALFGVLAAAVALAGIGIAYKRSVDPLHAQQSFDSGMWMLSIARYNQSVLAFDRAVGLKPDFAEAYLMRGIAFAAEEETDQAIRDYTKVIELRPADSRGWLARGTAFLDLKKFAPALDDANAALRLDRNLATAYNLRGLAVRAMGDPRKALDDLNAAVELAPNGDNYYQRGATYQMMQDHIRAIADLDRVIWLRPDASPAYFARAESRRALGELDLANADYRKGRSIEGHSLP